MLYKIKNTVFVVCLTSVIFTACGQQKPQPEVASSAELSGYAVNYPAKLAALTQRWATDAAEADKILESFKQYPSELKDPDWNLVLNVTMRADEEGRSSAYVYRVDEGLKVHAFFDEERDDITRRVSGAVDNQAQKAECECELDAYGKISYALKDSVSKQLEKRIKNESESARLIDRYKKSLGKKNADKLEKQARSIARASYIVFVELPEIWNEIDRLASEERKVKRTLENALEAERAFSSHPEVSKQDKKASEKRILELEEALAAIDANVETAKGVISKGETEIPAARDRYQKAFDNLCDAISSKVSETQ